MTLSVENLAQQINAAAPAFDIGGLQALRAMLHNKHARTAKLFHKATIFPNYAFHDGGRKELQFNIGRELRVDGTWWRHGVAFSFEPGQSLPDPTVLLPKVDCFNEWLHANQTSVGNFRMWDWDGESPSADRTPSEISDELAQTGVFVFLGDRYREAEIDVDKILRDFDRLYPLYEFVESRSQHLMTMVALPEEIADFAIYNEGGVQRILVNRYERDSRARRKCVEHHGAVCAVCGFDFGAVYGEIMSGFIHVHHLKQLSDVGPGYIVDPVSDLCPLCPNCHAAAHRKNPPYSLSELRSMLKTTA